MNGTPDTPNDLKPLRLVPGYRISDDGRVFKANGKPVKPLTLKEARRKAAESAIELDPKRHGCEPSDPKRRQLSAALMQRMFELGFEPQQLESLVYNEPGEGRMVQWVRLPSKGKRQTSYRSEAFTVECAEFTGGSVPAVGDTETGWYRLEHDGAWNLFHGPSWLAHERQR